MTAFFVLLAHLTVLTDLLAANHAGNLLHRLKVLKFALVLERIEHILLKMHHVDVKLDLISIQLKELVRANQVQLQTVYPSCTAFVSKEKLEVLLVHAYQLVIAPKNVHPVMEQEMQFQEYVDVLLL